MCGKAWHCYHCTYFDFHLSGKHFIFSKAWLRSPLFDRNESLILGCFPNQNHGTATFHSICSTSCEGICKAFKISGRLGSRRHEQPAVWWPDRWCLIMTGWSTKFTKPATSKQPKPNTSQSSEFNWEGKRVTEQATLPCNCSESFCGIP